METQIFTNDYQPPPSLKDKLNKEAKKTLAKAISLVVYIKKPKIAAVAALIFVFVTSLIAIAAMSKEEKRPETQLPQTQLESSTKSATLQSTPTDEDLSGFINSLQDQTPYADKLKKPIVVLDLGFEKE